MFCIAIDMIETMEIETVKRLYREMAPADAVLDQLQRACLESTEQACWLSTTTQALFVSEVLEDPVTLIFPPAQHYKLNLVKKYTSEIERSEEGMSDALMEVMAELLCSGRPGGGGEEEAPCHLTYCVPPVNEGAGGGGLGGGSGDDAAAPPPPPATVTLRVQRRHNDVGLRPWEAAFRLADYCVAFKERFLDKNVLELGSGVGLTGLVIALCTKAKKICLTDYTPEVLSNLRYNLQINSLSGISESSGREEYGMEHQEHSINENQKVLQVEKLDWNHPEKSPQILSQNWDIILAADIFYDQDQIPSLANLMHLFLMESENKRNNTQYTTTDNTTGEQPPILLEFICAYTLRNEETLQLLRACLAKLGVHMSQLEPYEEQKVDAFCHETSSIISEMMRRDLNARGNVFLCRLHL